MEEKITLTSSNDCKIDFFLHKSFNKGKFGTDNLICQSMKHLGCGRSVLVDKDNNVISGTKTIRAAKNLGFKIKVVECSADELVVVKRSDVLFCSKSGYELSLVDNLIPSKTLDWDTNEVLDAIGRVIAFDPSKWGGHECVVKELDLEELLKEGVNISTKQAKKTNENTNSMLQLNLFEENDTSTFTR